jgi:hypothetical protein
MSFDYNVLVIDPNTQKPIGACDHQQSFERYVCDFNDFRTLHYAGNTVLNMRAPINGSDAVRMWIRGEEVKQDDPVYGWSLVRDSNRLDAVNSTDQFYKIVFNKPVRLVVPLIEVSYLTQQGYCIKCSAMGVLNDFKVAASGTFVKVTQQAKLAQKGLKWILTSRCAFYPSFVCPLKSFVGKKLGIQLTDTDIANAVTTALTQMQAVQQAQATVQASLGGNMDPLEMIKDIQYVTAQVATNDPTTIQVAALITTFNGTSVPLSFQMMVNT